jgi:hypothetical protein
MGKNMDCNHTCLWLPCHMVSFVTSCPMALFYMTKTFCSRRCQFWLRPNCKLSWYFSNFFLEKQNVQLLESATSCCFVCTQHYVKNDILWLVLYDYKWHKWPIKLKFHTWQLPIPSYHMVRVGMCELWKNYFWSGQFLEEDILEGNLSSTFNIVAKIYITSHNQLSTI